jgi:hypothetical protein
MSRFSLGIFYSHLDLLKELYLLLAAMSKDIFNLVLSEGAV